jgi:hypothetical protein
LFGFYLIAARIFDGANKAAGAKLGLFEKPNRQSRFVRPRKNEIESYSRLIARRRPRRENPDSFLIGEIANEIASYYFSK